MYYVIEKYGQYFYGYTNNMSPMFTNDINYAFKFNSKGQAEKENKMLSSCSIIEYENNLTKE